MIEIKNLKKSYGERVVLDIPHLKIEKGDRIILTGHNGSGKSTLLKILSGIITDFEGTVKIEGAVYYLPQQCVPFNKSVKKNITYALGEAENKKEICEDILNRLNLKTLENKNAKTLSGGECQRLCLGRVIAKKGDILILDEPTSAADSESTALIEKVIENYQKDTNCTLIMTTHSKEQAEKLKGKKIELKDGKLVDVDA